MRHGTNFIFSNRDLRSPQASTPPLPLPPSASVPRCTAEDYFFPLARVFSPPSPPSRFSSAPSSHAGILIFRASRRAPRKHKKRYLYESVFWFFFFLSFFFAATLPLSSRSFISIELPSRVFLRARLVPWRPFHPAPSGNRNEGRK